jgi:hypothetical protein
MRRTPHQRHDRRRGPARRRSRAAALGRAPTLTRLRPVDLRREQREYLNVLYLRDGDAWRLVTFEDPDFDPGFATELPLAGRHTLQISIFADNADTVTSPLVADATADRHHIVLELV